MTIPFTRLAPDAKSPARSHPTDAGYDLCCIDDNNTRRPLHPGERRLFSTGLILAIPSGFYGHICDRSGNALKRGLHVLGGICDASYRGPIGVILLNTSDDPIWLKAGDRIAQLLIKRHESPLFMEVASLDNTDRGVGGFGSTGS